MIEKLLSVVLPSYNEEKNISMAAQRIGEILQTAEIPYELVFVDDGSKDRTWTEIEKASEKDTHVAGVHFSRNFGKESAVFAGLAAAKGDCVAVMDCDLQHPPETLVEMYRLWEQGYEVVEGVKRSRGKESALHRTVVGIFYRIISRAVGIDMRRASDFKLLDRTAVDALLAMPERNSFFRALSAWIGYKTTAVEFDVREREEGESKWSTRALIKYAVNDIVSFSSAPMQFVTVCGGLMFLIAVIMGIQTLVHYFRGNAVAGFTTVILLILLIGSMIMFSLGIIGYYLSRIYEEVKGRPKYLVSRKIESRQ
ncbi:MAG: glycosyltransferase family 2 protein [Eubacteriales bacterium]|nr:glycosyltransferase family 2 protein [Eubacteriales bacterium]